VTPHTPRRRWTGTCVGRAVLIASLVVGIAVAGRPAPAADSPSRIFTLAGGGDRRAVNGLAAAEAALAPRRLVPRPDGGVTVLDGNRLLDITPLGTVHPIPSPTERSRVLDVDDAATTADGRLLSLAGGVVRAWDPQASAWILERDLRGLPGAEAVIFARLVTVDDGRIIAGIGSSLWWWAPGRPVQRLRLPRGVSGPVDNATALPGGRLAVATGGADAIAILGPDGTVRYISGKTDAFAHVGFAGLPDGSILRAEGTLDRITVDGRVETLAGARPDLGDGDGDAPARATLSADTVAVLADGSIAVSESGITTPGGPPLILNASPLRGGGLLPEPDPTRLFFGDVRVLPSPASSRPLAALDRATYTSIGRGHVVVNTTSGGHATVEVRRRRGRQLVAKREADIAQGQSTVPISPAVPGGDYDVRLRLSTPEGAIAGDRSLVVTRHTLPMNEALAALRADARQDSDSDGEGGYYTLVQACQRQTAQMVTCRRIDVDWESGRPDKRTCIGLTSAILRPDGIRIITRAGNRRCRRWPH
jgi:hypothetical protein